MKYDITHALQSLKTGAEWALRGDDYSGLEWLDKSQTKPTEDEINAKVTELNNAEPMRLLREERDRLIGQSDWRIVKAKETSTNIPAAWKTYRQALRDLPANTTDLANPPWPTKPS